MFSIKKNRGAVSDTTNSAGGGMYITYGLIAVNIFIFILMVMGGAGLMIPDNNLAYLKWGSDYAPLTLSGDYWRLITNTFIHFGIIHLAMNMYCLFIIGSYLEPLLGRIKFISAYLCTGVFASLVSLWWHAADPVNSAGASGAIFGMYGLFLALLTTDIIPVAVRKGLLQNIGIFIAYNLLYGVKSGVDNSAHVGGLVSGFIIGYLYVINFKAEKKEMKANWVLPAVIIITIVSTVFFLDKFKEPGSQRKELLAEIKEGDHKDLNSFNDKYNEFVVLQDSALAPLKDGRLTDTLKQNLTDISMPLWNKADALVSKMQQMDVGETFHKKADLVSQYIVLRREEINDIISMINGENGAEEKHHSTILKIDSIAEQIK